MAFPIIALVIPILLAIGGYIAYKAGFFPVDQAKQYGLTITDGAKEVGTTEVATTGKSFAYSLQDAINSIVTHFGLDPMRFWFLLLLIIVAALIFMARASILVRLITGGVIIFALVAMFL